MTIEVTLKDMGKQMVSNHNKTQPGLIHMEFLGCNLQVKYEVFKPWY